MKKRILACFAILAGILSGAVFGAFPARAANETEYEYITEENVTLKYTVNGDSATITGYTGTCVTVRIPSSIGGKSVTQIGHGAFQLCDELQKVEIPDSVTLIEGAVFNGCSSLQEVNIPTGATLYLDFTFRNCSKLKNITLPKEITYIGGYAFDGCSSLQEIKLPENITGIGQVAFRGCTGLKSVDIPDGVTSIDMYAFENCSNLRSVRIPASVSKIQDNVFTNSGLEVIYGKNGSYVSEWAQKNKYTFRESTYCSFDASGGSIDETGRTVFYGDFYRTLPIPARTNHTFLGWFTQEIEGTRVTADTLVSTCEPHTLYAHWANEMVPKDISTLNLITLLEPQDYTYTGNAYTPKWGFMLTDEDADNIVLTENQDYTISYADNVDAGTASIIFTGMGNYTGNKILTFTINKSEHELVSDFSDSDVFVGESLQLITNAYQRKPSLGAGDILQKIVFDSPINYSSSNTAVATVDSKGRITGVEPGTAVITAFDAGNRNYNPASTTVTVTVKVKPLSSQMISVVDTVYTGNPLEPTVTVRHGDKTLLKDKDYTLSYINNRNAGTGSVKVTGKGGYTGSATKTFTVKRAGQTVAASLSAVSIQIGQTAQITAKGTGSLSYSSNAPAVASVNARGLVTGVSPGTAVITVSAAGDSNHDPANTTVTITVSAENAPGPVSQKKQSQAITVSSKTVAYKSKTFSLKAKASGGGKLTYKSSNKKVATVSSAGKVTVKNYGQATITVKAAAKGNYLAAEKKITVKVVPKTPALKKVSSPGKKRISASWNKDKTVDGYQMYICLRKDFKKGAYERTYKKTVGSMKLTGLKSKKTYYIKMRSYKKVGKKKFYSGWSKVKKVKVK